MEIKQKHIQQTSESKNYYLNLEINDKNIEISFCKSYDNNSDCLCDEGWDMINKKVDLTDEEKNAIDDYISNMDLSEID